MKEKKTEQPRGMSVGHIVGAVTIALTVAVLLMVLGFMYYPIYTGIVTALAVVGYCGWVFRRWYRLRELAIKQGKKPDAYINA